MENKKTGEAGLFSGVGTLIKGELRKRRESSAALFFDAVVIIVSFLFSRCHIVFGAYPLGVAFVAVLDRGVWLALVGSVVGALTLGKSGIIHAVISIVVVFLRVIISGGDSRGEGGVFKEPLLLRISSAAIGAFVGGVYEILLGGFALKSILYGVSFVLLSAGFTLAFFGISDAGISFSDFLTSKRNLFDRTGGERERFEIYLFQATFLLFTFLVSISLKEYNFFGISPSYVFAAFITLFVARRFGPIRAMAVGFVASLGISSAYAPAFALMGLASGILFSAGIVYALIAGGLLISLWSAYAGGAVGFLSTFPEYSVAALLSAPVMKKIPTEEKMRIECEARGKEAEDMVSATAVTYRAKEGEGISRLLSSLSSVSDSLLKMGAEEGCVLPEEYRSLVIEVTKNFCRACHFYDGCRLENPAPCAENIDLIAAKLCKKERIFHDDASLIPRYCHNSTALFERIAEAAADLEEKRFRGQRISPLAEECEIFRRMICEVQSEEERERALDSALSEKLSEALDRTGILGGVIKVFGERKKHFICAGVDRSGALITSKDFHADIESIAGVKLCEPEYYRRGDIALMECSAQKRYRVEFSAVGRCAIGESVSGDRATSFESSDGHFYALVCDGMGKGEEAHKASNFSADFLSRILDFSCSKSTAFHFLNHIIGARSGECSVTLDLFDFDLYTGDAVFFKCGAAASYIKRESSIFRIRSETAPLGIMKNIDAERIRVEIKGGDYIVMLSDGVSQTPEDATWLLEMLNKPASCEVREYAEKILDGAREHTNLRDDMSVAVLKIVEI